MYKIFVLCVALQALTTANTEDTATLDTGEVRPGYLGGIVVRSNENGCAYAY